MFIHIVHGIYYIQVIFITIKQEKHSIHFSSNNGKIFLQTLIDLLLFKKQNFKMKSKMIKDLIQFKQIVKMQIVKLEINLNNQN